MAYRTWTERTQSRYAEKLREEADLAYRVGTWLAVSIFPFGTIIDWATHPEHIALLFAIRWATSLLAVLLYLCQRVKRIDPEYAGLALLCIAFASVTAMTWVTGGYTSTYFHGLYPLLLACALLPWGPRKMIPAVFGMSFTYILIALIQAGLRITSPDIFTNDLYLIGLVATIGCATSWVGDKLRREAFAKRMEAEALATQLEARVRERTEQLERAIRERDDIVAIVSHDLRNPISSIQLNAAVIEPLLDHPEKREKLLKAVEIIRRASRRMEALVQDLLDLSKIESGHFTLTKGPVQPETLLTEALEFVRAIAERKNISLEQLCETRDALECDHERVLQVFSNLLGNAIKFTPEGGTIRVTCSRDAGELRFGVIDNGPGISPENLPQIFNRFWQAKHAGRAGAGLGLSISQGIVKAHGGRIWVESRLSQGARFYFTLPIQAGASGLFQAGAFAPSSSLDTPRPARSESR